MNWTYQLVYLRYDEPGDVAHTFNDLVDKGVVYGHQRTVADIRRDGAAGTIQQVQLTPRGVVLLVRHV